VTLPSIAPVVEKAKLAVVNIYSLKTVKTPTQPRNRTGPPPIPPEDFFEDFMEEERPERPPNPEAPEGLVDPNVPPPVLERVQGSGFIVDKEGYVITNNHVVEWAEEITVKFGEEEEIPAEIVGRDPTTDLALLRLTKPGDYPYLVFGDSDKVNIGDWLLAIGNPFGLEHTVTKGVLSARGRVLGAGLYDDFLQTDASINPGNSGGPLLNLKAEVVGVNSMIYAGGSGIGFSIPSRQVKKVVELLKTKGYVERGYIGAVVQPLTDDLAASFGLKSKEGALIGDALPDAPASQAGLKPGDVIVEFDGRAVKGVDDLTALAAEATVGQKIQVAFIRDQKRMTADLTVSRLDEPVPDNGGSPQGLTLDLGLTLREINPETAKRLGVTAEAGLLVEQSLANYPARNAGVFARDVILEIDQKPVKTLVDYHAALRSHTRGEPILLWLRRGERTIYRSVTVAKSPLVKDQK
jgi:serine protease Do